MERRVRTGTQQMTRRPRRGLPDAAARQEAGASAVEFAIAAPALLLALLGTFQAALLYQARAQLEVATQEAVRAGTLHGARVEAMRDALARGLTPLYTHGQNLSALAQGYAIAKVAAGQATIRVLSPTREAFDDFAEQTRDTSGAWIRAIPVDHLGYRQTNVGSGSHLSVQDATLLKVQITAVQPLIVPFIDQIGRGIYQMDKGLGNLGLPSLFGIRLSPIIEADGKIRWGIPMQAEAVMRMQSPVLAEGLPSKASLGQGQNTDPGNDEGEDFNEVIPIYDENPDQPGSPADTPPPGACTGGSPFDN
ncbi:TadE family protein [Acidithiobacillus ferrivorans SS3]|uniref:TadE family protein n=1 Tax=Acidithiobacillus ferrivorans SS3 TaxID=743299 RepID=G0JRZ3_9PROT|nr:TadE/TadG family type IV pilus assembly protein [Acidithiobacillus ferrivorans]AEM46501.1 TadE family protein [Acidithiobacillus ferrivorans SS3]OFA14884.1 pilus assembly protein TadE [Acidithiobacillus ferrivorans]